MLQRPAGDEAHFQRTQQVHAVARIDGERPFGIELLQLCEEGSRPLRLQALSERFAQGRISTIHERQMVNDRAHVEHRPSDQKRHMCSLPDLPDHTLRLTLVPCRSHFFLRIKLIEKVMRNPLHVLCANLGRADIESAVKLARIGIDDLHGLPLLRKSVCQRDRKCGLAARRGSDEHEEWTFCSREKCPDVSDDRRLHSPESYWY